MMADPQWLSPTDVFERVEELLTKQNRFEVPPTGPRFEARLLGSDIQFDDQDGGHRIVSQNETLRFIRRFQSLDRPHVADFHRDTRNGDHLFALVSAALAAKGPDQASDVKAGSLSGSPRKRKAKRPRL